jgi:predicted AAA+ superfamily ATPase
LTWFEKAGSPAGGVSLKRLASGDTAVATAPGEPNLEPVVERILQPGFPALAELTAPRAARLLRAYAEEVARADLSRLAQVRHDPPVVYRLIKALARSVASDVEYETLAKDVRSLAPAVKAETVSSYVTLLERLFLVERQEAWAPRLQSRARLRRAAKLHLADPALAAAVTGATASRLLADTEYLGLLFESAAVHDLAVFAQQIDAEVKYYRDSNGHEIDAVVTLPDGAWGAVEVKLGGPQLELGAWSLAGALAQLDLEAMGEPVFRLVLTGTGPTLRLDSGIVTCPLSALAP